jgi:molybdate transport system regulatory protein
MFLSIEWSSVHDAIGPHRANMLEAIDRLGSISAAAPAVDLSVRQLLASVHILNSLFDEPLVELRRGRHGGGASLTPIGKEVLTRFREMEQVGNKALKPYFRAFEKRFGIDSTTPPAIPRYAQIVSPDSVASLAKEQPRQRKPRQKTKTSKHFYSRKEGR